MSIKEPLFVHHLSVFFLSFEGFEKLGLPRREKNGANLGAGPPIFDIFIKCKLRHPIYDTNTKPYCPCGCCLDPYGDHVFQCKHICKIGAHNSIRDSLPSILTPALSSAGYLLPTSKFTVEPMLHLPSDPNARPLDIAFNPNPALPPNVTHACPYTSISANITISCPPPHPNFDLNSPDVLNILSANADAHLQVCKKQKIDRGNKRNPTTGTTIPGDAIIGNILHHNMTLIPFVIDPFGRLGPILCHSLFSTRPTVPLFFLPS